MFLLFCLLETKVKLSSLERAVRADVSISIIPDKTSTQRIAWWQRGRRASPDSGRDSHRHRINTHDYVHRPFLSQCGPGLDPAITKRLISGSTISIAGVGVDLMFTTTLAAT